jgi:dextranase
MTTAPFRTLKTWYPADQEVLLGQLPPRTARVIARSAFGEEIQVPVNAQEARLPGLSPGTYAIEAWSAPGEMLGDELTTVSASPGDRAVPGFVTSFSPDAVAPTLAWLRALRCTTVQFYDWMASYAEPLAATDSYCDRLGREHSLAAIALLTAGCRELGATPQAYAPVYAVDPDFGREHPGWLLFRGDGEPQRLGDLLQIADPGNSEWQRHWLAAYGVAADALGFGGFHLDTYGYPREPLDVSGQPVTMHATYTGFLQTLRAARPTAVLSFNQVNGVPRDFELTRRPGFRYLEVWPPNDRWRHLEGLLSRSTPGGGGSDGNGAAVLALYPPSWSGERADSLRTVLLTEAVATTLGASLLVFGDDLGCLRHPYYPDYQQLTAAEAGEVLRWHRFALRCRDLFAGGMDTSWTDIGDENGAVSVRWLAAADADATAGAAAPEAAVGSGLALPEPDGGAMFARVVRHDRCVTVSVLDLTGSPVGSWQAPTRPGRCRRATVTVLLAEPGQWTAEAAVLGRGDDRFTPVAIEQRAHREGTAVEIDLPVADGWSVLRLSRR